METIAANDELTPSNIVLTGFMGTGKTAVGRILANETGREFVDTDDLIVHRTGLSIVRLFRERGEEDFRRLETELIREYAGKRDLVIATGGRLMLNPLNALLVHGRAAIFCLVASPEEILARVKNDPRRRPLLEVDDPLLTIRKLLDQRQEGYNQFIQFNTEGKKPHRWRPSF